jgi:hypothetical protein
MEITRVVTESMILNDETGIWDITMHTKVTRKEKEDSKEDVTEYAARTYDTSPLSGLTVLDNATRRYFKDYKGST